MKLLPSCREVRERLTDYAEGSLTARERASVRMHLLLCFACAAFYRGLRALPGVARFLLAPEDPPPAEAAQALRGALDRLGRHRHRP
jgi:anti-sigma factor ChrR (cupin superfamily)